MPENTPPETNHSTASVIAKILDVVGPLIALIFVFGLFAILDQLYGSQQFLSETNIRTILIQTAVVAVAALGMTMIIISGGIDLSAGTALALCATVLAWGLNEDVAYLISQGENFESVSEQLEKDQKAYRKLAATTGKDSPKTTAARSNYDVTKKRLMVLLEIKTNQVALLEDSEKKSELLPILEGKKENLNDPDYIFTANIKWLKNIPNSPWSIWIALVMALITGVVTGLVNGALITPTIKAPAIVPKIEPRPPLNDPPPITTAAMISNSFPPPPLGFPLESREKR